ncbi:MAG: hypothetical protein MUC60_11685 [Oscillatoria sp. Prado101]|nr:hypothetical protein [Oscillatoria sp. Prado101]
MRCLIFPLLILPPPAKPPTYATEEAAHTFASPDCLAEGRLSTASPYRLGNWGGEVFSLIKLSAIFAISYCRHKASSGYFAAPA